MKETLIVTSPEELKKIVAEAVNSAGEGQKIETDAPSLNIDEAVVYMRKKGYRISKSTVYARTMKKTIPFHRFGKKKIVFRKEELDQWISSQLYKNQ